MLAGGILKKAEAGHPDVSAVAGEGQAVQQRSNLLLDHLREGGLVSLARTGLKQLEVPHVVFSFAGHDQSRILSQGMTATSTPRAVSSSVYGTPSRSRPQRERKEFGMTRRSGAFTLVRVVGGVCTYAKGSGTISGAADIPGDIVIDFTGEITLDPPEPPAE